jgi:hypothetical protein
MTAFSTGPGLGLYDGNFGVVRKASHRSQRPDRDGSPAIGYAGSPGSYAVCVFFAGRGDVFYVRRSLEVWPNDLAIRLTKDFCTELENIGADELDRLDVTARYIRDFI